MAKKTFNEKLHDSKNMPEVKELTDEKAIKKFGRTKMLIAPPIDYDKIMKKVPYGKIITSDYIRNYLAKNHDADFTCPLTGGIFINIVAKASEERDDDKTPYFRTLKKDGELNDKYPDGIEKQKAFLEEEGHNIIQKGKRYFVDNYKEHMFEL